MREINECTAEVFRRSEKRIKERKRNRNRILMCCIPFLICITVFSATILPAMMPASNKDSAAEENMQISDADGSAGSTACSYVSVEVKSKDTEHSKLITDKLNVDQLYFSILDATEINADVGESPDDDGNDFENKESASGTVNYEFTFKTAEGDASTYRLAGNILFCVETEQTIYLSDEQYNRIIGSIPVS